MNNDTSDQAGDGDLSDEAFCDWCDKKQLTSISAVRSAALASIREWRRRANAALENEKQFRKELIAKLTEHAEREKRKAFDEGIKAYVSIDQIDSFEELVPEWLESAYAAYQEREKAERAAEIERAKEGEV